MPRFRPLTFILLTLLLVLVSAGCGSSANDPFERAKLRKRPDAEPAPAGATTPAAGFAEAPEAPEESLPRGTMPAVATSDSDAGGDADASAKEEAGATPVAGDGDAAAATIAGMDILPIEERRPEQPLSEEQRRARSAEKIQKVAKALLQYAGRKGELPKPGEIKSEGGIATLSWRVAILPDLGYEDLYHQFDPNEPWDGEHNRKLLDYIPDEFVSLERYDTKTNYLGPAFRSFLFGVDRLGVDAIEDGAANTILLVEVDDPYAVEWTRPQDFDMPALQLENGLGKLRGDGAIAVWANGMSTLLPNNATQRQLLNAFTHDASDGQLAAVLHRPITVDVVAAEAVAAAESDRPAEPASQPTAAAMSHGQTQPEAAVRDAVPKAAELAEANEKLRGVFLRQLEQAQSGAQRAAIAQQMIEQAQHMKQDVAGAFALLTAAISLAAQTGQFAIAVDAVEAKIRRFEVDAYEENARMMAAFGKANSGRLARRVGGDEYIQRAIRVIHAGIAADDFDRAATITRYALMFKGENGRDPTVVMLNRLRSQLSVARGHYSRTGDSLAALRDNPRDDEAAEEVGRFLCFIKGDWDNGLPLLARSQREALKQLAEADLAGSQTPQGKLKLADRWWELAERTTEGVFRQACRDRAVMWYEDASAQLPESLDKLHAKARLDEAGDSKATSPLALVKRLASESNVDLTASLAGI